MARNTSSSISLLVVGLGFTLALTGCAVAPLVAKQTSSDELRLPEKVEIFYSPEDHVVAQDLGNNTRSYMGGLVGLLGPLGAIAGAAVSFAATKSAMDQIPIRSREFAEAIRRDAAAHDMNRDFAQQLAQRLQGSGRLVKLTEVPRLPGARPGFTAPPVEAVALMPAGGPTGSSGGASREMPASVPKTAPVAPKAGNGYVATPGFAPLLLRITTGYVARESYEDYKPLVIVEYALAHADGGHYLANGTLAAAKLPNGSGYSNWDQLRTQAGPARVQLRDALLGLKEKVLAELAVPLQ